jgi:alkylation response protein AidB-like acyl-CoA dehydrogenase
MSLLIDDQKMFVDQVRRMVADKVEPRAAEIDKKGDKYVINGSKCFISNWPIANLITLFAMTDSSKGVHGISGFIVETDTPGFCLRVFNSHK